MLSNRCKSQSRSQATRESILKGVVPEGLSFDEIINDLTITNNSILPEMVGIVSLQHYRNGKLLKDYGVASCKLVTVAFTQYLVDSMQDSTTYPMDVFDWHAFGTGTTAESNTDTTLETEVDSREQGTLTEGATANIFKTVATHEFAGTHTITEFGVLSAETVGTLLDRAEGFTPIPVIATDTITSTYQLTVIAET